ncbi:MAG TPA: extracellular solute-binding protein [Firmicutes bacterium]|nr:extracellular solute-binding protein [Bacillota bacterium]
MRKRKKYSVIYLQICEFLSDGTVAEVFRKFAVIFVLLLFLTAALTGCGTLGRANKIASISLWHNYGGQLKETMDSMIDEFNETVGLEEGIIINVTSISGSASIHEKLLMAANRDPGAPSLPDITTAYPKTAFMLAEKGLLADLSRLFSQEELSAYVLAFLQEGLLDNKLYVFPTAKSTEVLFLNKTIFDRFAKDTGVTVNDLQTFEGIKRAADLYYKWSGGKMFFMADSLFNLTLNCYRQFGESFILADSLNLQSPVFKKVWDVYFKPAVLGHTAIFDGYATDLARTGDIICSVGSTAGISFFSSTVTYPDNTSETVDWTVLPYPVFEGGGKAVVQRGAGMSIIKSGPETEKKAAVFLEWFTRPENNIRFVASTGYLPVTKEAFNQIMHGEYEADDDKISELRNITKAMQEGYEFYIPPVVEGLDGLQSQYESSFRAAAANASAAYIKSNDPEAVESIVENAYNEFVQNMTAVAGAD